VKLPILKESVMEAIKGLAGLCVRHSDGTVDVDATLSEVADQLVALAEAEATLAGAISEAVHGVFDAHLGKVLPMPAVTSLAVQAMGVSPEHFATTTEAVATWIRNCGQFRVAKGKGGGVARLRDLPAEVK
jgi:hypothetical protein